MGNDNFKPPTRQRIQPPLAANTTVTGTLEVSDNATITGAFVVENNTTVTGTLAVTGNTTLTNDLTVQGTTTLATTTLGAVLRDYDGDVGTAGQVLSTTGTSTQWVDNTTNYSGTTTNSTLRWNGTDWVETTTLLTADTAGGTATLAANTTVTGTLEVSDNATITGAFVVANNATVTGTLAVTGNTTLTNDLTVQGTTTLATTTLNGPVIDSDGELGQVGQVLSATATGTNWINTTTGGVTLTTTNYNASIDDGSILVQPSTALTINLPTPTTADNGKTLTIKRVNTYQGTGDTLTIFSSGY